jgi:nucleotide-binding universal stress UspA family protein
MKKILVPCDFSAPAQEAFKFAANIAQKNKSEIYVLYVIDNTFVNSSSFGLSHLATFNGIYMQKLEEQLNEKFVEMKSRYAPGVVSTFKIDIGSLTQTIESYSREKKLDLIVMGTHGASGLKEFFVGSNTEKVVRYSAIPVIAVPEKSKTDGVRDIVFPVVPREYTSPFVREIKTIQNFFDARLHILWINTPHIFKSDREAMEDLQEFADYHKFSNYTLNVRNEHIEQEGILHFGREINADLIAMPTHNRKGLIHWLSGSITENVVNHVHCPVWTFSIKE